MEKIYEELKKIGFSKYESKAYITLLQTSPITGYEVSKRSGVPRSMIYEVLGKLIDRGAIYTVPDEPIKYAPIPATELIERLRRNISETFNFLESALHSIEKPTEVEVIKHIQGNDKITNEIISIINNAERELWLSVWEKQLHDLKDSVKTADQRGISIFSILFGAEKERIGFTFHHNYMPPEVVKNRIGGHLTVAVRDNSEVIIANFNDQTTSWAVKTQDPALILVATEFIRHDIMIEEITKEYGAEKLDKLWRNKQELIHVVTGEEIVKEGKYE